MKWVSLSQIQTRVNTCFTPGSGSRVSRVKTFYSKIFVYRIKHIDYNYYIEPKLVLDPKPLDSEKWNHSRLNAWELDARNSWK